MHIDLDFVTAVIALSALISPSIISLIGNAFLYKTRSEELRFKANDDMLTSKLQLLTNAISAVGMCSTGSDYSAEEFGAKVFPALPFLNKEAVTKVFDLYSEIDSRKEPDKQLVSEVVDNISKEVQKLTKLR